MPCLHLQDEYNKLQPVAATQRYTLSTTRQSSTYPRIPTPKAVRAARPVKKHQALKATNHPITTAQLVIAQNVKHGSLHKRPRTIDHCCYLSCMQLRPKILYSTAHAIALHRSLPSLKNTTSLPRLSLQWSSRDRQRYWRLCCAGVAQSSLALFRRLLPQANK